MRAMYGRRARGWSPLLVKVPVVKPFGSKVKKEVRKNSKRRKKVCGHVAGEGEYENGGQ